MSLLPEPSPFRVADLRDGGLHPFPTLDAEPDERADLGAEFDRLGLGEVAGVCFLAFAWVRCGMLRRLSPFPDDDASARATDTAGEACRVGGAMSPAAGRRRSPASAADGDREHAAEMLRNAYAAGRIELEELRGRADAAYSARTWGELRDLTADLPPGQGCSCAASGAGSAAGVARPGHAPRRPRAAIWVTAVIWVTIAAAAHTAAAIPLVVLSLFLLRAASARCAEVSLIAVGQAGHPALRARRCAPVAFTAPGGAQAGAGGRR
jgi:hypothetical protein